ncbi:GNAT family N-acetyltransferase [Microbacterium aurantiacum]
MPRQRIEDDEVWEVGYHLVRSAWGRGLAAEGAARAVEWAFGHDGVESVHAEVRDTNPRSRSSTAGSACRTWTSRSPAPSGRPRRRSTDALESTAQTSIRPSPGSLRKNRAPAPSRTERVRPVTAAVKVGGCSRQGRVVPRLARVVPA